MSRRAFLVRAGGFIVAASLPVGCAEPSFRAPGFELRYFSPFEYAVVNRVADRVVPGVHGLPGPGVLGVARQADGVMALLDPSLKAQFHQLLTLFDRVPILAGRLGPFVTQGPRGAEAYLAAWEDSPFEMLRHGFQGLRRLAAAVYYADPGIWGLIGYAGPWVGRIDVGYGLDNQGNGPLVNPNVYSKFTR